MIFLCTRNEVKIEIYISRVLQWGATVAVLSIYVLGSSSDDDIVIAPADTCAMYNGYCVIPIGEQEVRLVLV